MTAMPRGFGDGGDRRQVLHLEGQRARALDEDRPGLVGDQRGDAAADARIVVARPRCPCGVSTPSRDAARRLVGAVGDQHLVAGVEHRQQRQRDRRQAGRGEHRAGGAFELGDDLLDRRRRRIAGAAVVEARLGAFERVERRKQDGRAAIDRRVDVAAVVVGMPAGVGERWSRRATVLWCFFVHLTSILCGLTYPPRAGSVQCSIRRTAMMPPRDSPRSCWPLPRCLGAAPAFADTARRRQGARLRAMRRDRRRAGLLASSDANNDWAGLEVDYCRAVAAAIFNDPKAVRFTTDHHRTTAGRR